MKCSVAALVAAMAGVAMAQTLADFIPECAVKCLTDGVAAATNCKPDDLDCLCIADNYRATYTSAVSCVLAACGNDVSVSEVLPAAAHMCEVVVAAETSSSSSSSSTTTTKPATTAPSAATTTSSGPQTTVASSTTAAPAGNNSTVTTSAPTTTTSSGAARLLAAVAAVPVALAAGALYL